MAFLADHPSDKVVEALAAMLRSYRGREARALLLRLCEHPGTAAREAAARGLVSLLKRDVLAYRDRFGGDPVVYAVLQEYATLVES